MSSLFFEVAHQAGIEFVERQQTMCYAFRNKSELVTPDSMDVSTNSCCRYATMAQPCGYLSLPPELCNMIYVLVLREQPESGAILTISEFQGVHTVFDTTSAGRQETYQFPVPKEYLGLLFANKQTYKDLADLATRVYTAAHFEANKKQKLAFQVKKIIFNQQRVDTSHWSSMRFNLLAGTQMTDLMRFCMLSIYLRRIECNIEFLDSFGNAYFGKFSFGWCDAISDWHAESDGLAVWSMAMGHMEKDVRNVIRKMAINTHRGREESFIDLRSCKWLEMPGSDSPSGADTQYVESSNPGFTVLKGNGESDTYTTPPEDGNFAFKARDGDISLVPLVADSRRYKAFEGRITLIIDRAVRRAPPEDENED